MDNSYDSLDATVTDYSGHEIHVAGIVGATSGNKIGVNGIDQYAKICSYKAFTRYGWGQDSWIANAIYRAVHDGCQVLNMSFGGSGYSRILEEAILYAHSHGVVSVVAAGNGGSETQSFPAFFGKFSTQSGERDGFPTVITVGAINRSGVLASYTNRGWFVDVYAPGGVGTGLKNDPENILSTFPTYDVMLNDTSLGYSLQKTYGYLAGTSMATPFVVGTVGLMLAVNPNLIPAKVREIIVASADSIQTVMGVIPILNPEKAIILARSVSTTLVDSRRPNSGDFILNQNYPNPFNPTTNIEYKIKETRNVILKVFDVLGREVVSLVNEVKTPGVYNATLDASRLTSGTYIYRLQAGSFVETKKMVLMK